MIANTYQLCAFERGTGRGFCGKVAPAMARKRHLTPIDFKDRWEMLP